MLIGCLIAGIIILAGGAVVGIREVRGLNEKLDNYDRAFTNFFTSPGPDQMSPFTQVICEVSTIIAKEQAVVTQAAIRGSLGGQQRAMNENLEAVAISEDPNLAFAQVLPKSLKRNPLALMGLQAIMRNMGRGPGSPGPNGSGIIGDQAKFKL